MKLSGKIAIEHKEKEQEKGRLLKAFPSQIFLLKLLTKVELKTLK